MTTVEFQKILRTNLQSLSADRAIDFGINICKRLLPDYEAFHGKHHWGEFNLLRNVVEKAEIRTLEPDDLNELIQRIDAVIPDSDDFWRF